MKNWISKRLGERTTLDGAVLIVCGVTFLIFKPLATLVAYAAILYGVYTSVRAE